MTVQQSASSLNEKFRMRAEIINWWKQAEEDFDSAEKNFDIGK